MQVGNVEGALPRQTCLGNARDFAHSARKVTEVVFTLFLGFTVLSLAATAALGFCSLFGKAGVPPPMGGIAITFFVSKSLVLLMFRVSLAFASIAIVSGVVFAACYLTEATFCRLTGREITPISLHH